MSGLSWNESQLWDYWVCLSWIIFKLNIVLSVFWCCLKHDQPSMTIEFFNVLLPYAWCLSACLNQGMQAKAVEGNHREEEGHSVHQGSTRRWHWELHVRVAVWELCGPEDYRAVGHRWGKTFTFSCLHFCLTLNPIPTGWAQIAVTFHIKVHQCKCI